MWARSVRELIVQNGRVQRGRIGISAKDLPAGVAKSTGHNDGAVIVAATRATDCWSPPSSRGRDDLSINSYRSDEATEIMREKAMRATMVALGAKATFCSATLDHLMRTE